MSGKHSKPSNIGTKTDADGDVISMSGAIEESDHNRPYVPTPETESK